METRQVLVCRMVALALAALLAGCASLPTGFEKTPSAALAPDSESDTAKLIQGELASRGHQSGFRLMVEGTHALLSRVVLADRAQHSLDLQYYIFHDDATGHLIAQRLLAAADRGVRVRLLLDDVNIKSQSRMLVALDAHPNVEV